MRDYKIFISFLLLFVLIISACFQKADKEDISSVYPPPEAQIPAQQPWELEWNSTLEEAQKEGKIVVYAAFGARPAADQLRKVMKDKYNIIIDWTIGRGDEISAKLFAERRAGLYLPDVHLGGSDTVINVLVPAGVFEKIEGALILPEVKDPQAWRGELKFSIFESTRTVFRANAHSQDTIYTNTKMVKGGEIESIWDLVRLKWKGKILMEDPTVAGTAAQFFAHYIEVAGIDYMRQLAKQEPTILRDFSLSARWLAEGKYPILLGGAMDQLANLMEVGAPITFVKVKEGEFLSGGGAYLSLIKNSPHPNAARVFINWFLSKEGQTVWSETRSSPSLRLDVPTDKIYSFRVPDWSKEVFLETEEFIKKKNEVRALAREIFREYLPR